MMLTAPFRPCGLRQALNQEWSVLVAGPTGLPAGLPAAWPRRSPELAGCASLDEVLEAVRERPDAVLRALLGLCANGDRLAGRVVLQTMLGKLVRLAGRDPVAGLDDYVTAMWERICTYPVASRPHQIAANLALDTLKTVRRAAWAAAAVDVSPYPPSAFVETAWDRPVEVSEPELAARRVIAAAAGLGLITEDTRAVLTTVYADGLSGASAAERHGKSVGAIRVQCHKAVRTLAQHAQLLLEAA